MSSQAVLADQKHQHNGTHGNNNNTNKPTNDLAQIEKIKRIVQREILDNGRHLFPDGRWPSDGVGDPLKHPEPYTAAMKYGGRDPSSKKRPGLTKRPPNMWMIFRMHAASVVMEEFPEVNQAALTSVLAPIWQSVITPEEKDLVREESERLKEYHKMQFPEWKYKPRQKKRGALQQQQQPPPQQQQPQHHDEDSDVCDAPPAKRECQSNSQQARFASRQQQLQHQQQHQQHQHQHQSMMQDAMSPYLSSGSPDIDYIDGLKLPLSVDTSPQAHHASASLTSNGSAAAAAAAAASCLPPFPSPWGAAQVRAIPVSLASYLPAVSVAYQSASAASAAASPLSPHSAGTPRQQQQQHHHHQHQHHQHQSQPPSQSLKDPALRSILTASVPSSVSSTSGAELSCLPDLLPSDYFNDFVLPDLEAYLSPEGCSGGPVSELAPLSQQQHQQLMQCDFSDPTELRHLVKQEFSYAII